MGSRRESGAVAGPKGARLLATLTEVLEEAVGLVERLYRLEAELRADRVRRLAKVRQRRHRKRATP